MYYLVCRATCGDEIDVRIVGPTSNPLAGYGKGWELYVDIAFATYKDAELFYTSPFN